MNRIEKIAADPPVKRALDHLAANKAAVIEQAIQVQQIPAPTFEETRRAAYIRQQFHALGLEEVQQDEVGNLFGRVPGRATGAPVVVSAHMDTVFPAETDLAVSRKNGRIYGPGIVDNSTGVAGLLMLAEIFNEYELPIAHPIWLVANVAEEGLGDLRGMRAVVERFSRAKAYIVVEGGSFGNVFHQAIGVRRFRIWAETAGGHSWGDFGHPNAIHELGRLVQSISELQVPAQPKTTYNIGHIEGGTTINSIAARASFLLDLRSADDARLAELVGRVESLVRQAGRRSGVTFSMEKIGDRPAGGIDREAEIVRLATAALSFCGCSRIAYMNGSTDANIPLSKGYPAVCVGLAASGNTHRLDEYLDPADLEVGLSQLLLLTLAAAEYNK